MEERSDISSEIMKSIHNADIELLIPLLSEAIYTAKDIGLSSRNANHWRQKGLLFQSNDEKVAKTTAKFSLSEAIWIRAMQYMRNFGLSISDLSTIKKQIFEGLSLISLDENKKLWMATLKEELIKGGASTDNVELFMTKVDKEGLESMFMNNNLNYNPFEFLIVEALLNRNECGILILNGEKKEVTIWFDGIQEKHSEFSELLKMTHVYISFKQIFSELAVDGVLLNNNLLNDKELQILEALRKGNLKEVVVSAKKGKPYTIKVTSKEEEHIVAKLLLKHPKGNIKFLRNGNKIVGVEIVESRTL